MSINSMKTQCYKITKKDGRYHLFDNVDNLLIHRRDWKQIRGLYDYLKKLHNKSHTMKEIQNTVQTAIKSNGGFLLDNDEEEDENLKPVEKPVKKSVIKVVVKSIKKLVKKSVAKEEPVENHELIMLKEKNKQLEENINNLKKEINNVKKEINN